MARARATARPDRRTRRARRPGSGVRLRLTTRGRGLVVAGLVLVVVGLALRLSDVVALGAAPLLLVAGTAVWSRVRRVDRGRAALQITREVAPDPVVRGNDALVRLVTRPVRPTELAAGRLARTAVVEQVAPQVAARSPHGRETATAEQLELVYSLHPTARGRWPLGPATATVTDVFGLVRTSRPLGPVTTVTVWPATGTAAGPDGTSAEPRGETGSGLASAAADDAVLRTYVPGDDLRRVHWVSAARRGELMVRADEGAALPPVTVLVDRGLLTLEDARAPRPGERLPRGEAALEHAASVARTLLESDRATRVVGTSPAQAVTVPFVPGPRSDGVALLLDQTVDLVGLPAAEADDALVATGHALRGALRRDETLVAVVRPLAPAPLAALAALGHAGRCVALVVPGDGRRPDATAARATADALRSAGWRAVVDATGDGAQPADALAATAVDVTPAASR